MRTEELIYKKLKELKDKKLILTEVLTEIENENKLERGYLIDKIHSYSKEIYLLEWVLNIELPF